MADRIFYSWQSNQPNNVNRGFIEDALKKAIKQLGHGDNELFVPARDLELDKDTRGVPGSPPIAETIFDKISNCAVFVADLTFVGQTADNRPIPNPNVLIEYGYAQAKLGHRRLVGVMNAAYGEPNWETLPFNVRHIKWPITYTLASKLTSQKRQEQKKELVGNLVVALREALKETAPTGPVFTPMQPKSRVSSFLDEGDLLCTVMPWGTVENKSNIVWHDGPQMFIRVIPKVPVAEKTPLELVELIERNLSPFGRTYGTWIEGNEWGGVVFEARNESPQHTANRITQVSDRGEIWGIDGFTLKEHKVAPFFELHFAKKLAEYLAFAKDQLGISSDVTVVAGMTGVKGFQVFLPDPPKGHNYVNLEKRVGNAVKDEIVVEMRDISLEPRGEGNLEVADGFPYKIDDPVLRHAYEALLPLFERAWGIFQVPRVEHLPRARKQQ